MEDAAWLALYLFGLVISYVLGLRHAGHDHEECQKDVKHVNETWQELTEERDRWRNKYYTLRRAVRDGETWSYQEE